MLDELIIECDIKLKYSHPQFWLKIRNINEKIMPEKFFNVEFERAVRFLVEHMPISDESTRKPVLFHSIRVGVYLYENDYNSNIVLAGLLHDALEFSNITEQMLVDEFGENIMKLVRASSKGRSIADFNQRIDELIRRCAATSQDELIVKAADIIDSFKYYAGTNNKNELTNYCMKNADAIFRYRPDNFEDKILKELEKWRNKFSDSE